MEIKTTPSKGRWWPPRFSLRFLLIAVLIAGLVFARIHSARQREAAIDRLYDHGSIGFESEVDALYQFGMHHAFSAAIDMSFVHNVDNDAARDLWAVAEVKWLEIESDELTDEGLLHLDKLRNLEELILKAPRITDRGLRHLAALSRLKKLSIQRSTIGQDGLQHISKCSRLEELYLGGVQLDKQGAKHLARLTNLKKLGMSCRSEGSTDLSPLADLKALETLSINDSAPADAQWIAFPHLPALKELIIAGSSVGDAALVDVALCPKLERLNCENTRVTDKGLLCLATHPSLRGVCARETQITSQGAEKFRRRCPSHVNFTTGGSTCLVDAIEVVLSPESIPAPDFEPGGFPEELQEMRKQRLIDRATGRHKPEIP